MKFQATNKTGQRNAACELALPLSPSRPLALSSFSRRGSALLLVVVLVLLLALMGTTFLFVMRAARLQANGPGSGNLMQGSWPTVAQNDLDAAITTLKTSVVTAITNGVRPGGAYLLPTNPESAYTHPLTAQTTYLCDRFPVTELDRTAGGDSGSIFWRALTANPAHAGDTRVNLYASQYRVTYPTSGNWPLDAAGNAYPTWAQLALSGRTRFFPALTPTLADAKITASNPAGRFLAGDADGDGIVDCRLYYQNTANGYDFYTGVRVVDNSAAVNVNTAWRSTADYDFTNNRIPAANLLTGYLGAFRSNIGLYEMLIGSATENTGVASTGDADNDFSTLDGFRFSGAYASLKDIYTGNDGAAAGTKLAGVEYLTVADALEHGLDRRLDKSTKPGFYNTSTRFKDFDDSTLTHDQLVARFCLVSPNFSNTKLTANLTRTDLVYAPNTRNLGVVPQFQFYGANQSDYWYHTALSTDSAAGTSRQVFFATTGAGASANMDQSNFTLANIVKTIRPHLVGENGVTVSAPRVDPPAAGLVALSTDSTTWNNANAPMADYAAADTPRKAWANGAAFGELWRAYYGVFKAGGNPVQVNNYKGGNNVDGAGLPAWTADKQLILRAAIASINTIQARLPDTADALVQQVTIGGTAINVFGAKRQPFISEVMVEVGLVDITQPYDAVNNPTETKWVAIELHNPYNTAINLENYRLFVSNPGPAPTWIPGASFAGQGNIGANSYRVFVARLGSFNKAGTPIDTNPNLVELNAGDTAQLLGIVPAGGGNANVLRLVTSDGTTPNTANGYDMIPQDEVPLTTVNPDTSVGVASARYRYARYTGGNGFLCVFNELANGFAKATYDQATGKWSDAAIAAGTLTAPNPTASTGTAKKFTIQIANYSAFAPGGNQTFPFAGFARDGDLLHVAYIGNYAYLNGVSSYTCSVGRDAYYAEDGTTDDDGDATHDAYEAVGRFVPLTALNVVPPLAPPATPLTYEWAARLFDFVTAVQHPGSERNPDVVNAAEQLAYTGRSIQGKLNINTASWQALAALPLVPGSLDDTVKLAKAIVYFRDINDGSGAPHGAFKSIFDLNLVIDKSAATPAFPKLNMDFAGKAAGVASNAALIASDLTTAGVGGVGDISSPDNAKGDFEQRLLGLTRISNLITTRSDSFTVYIVAQAWKHDAALNSAGSPPPIMVGEKRTAFVMDRTGLTSDAINTVIDPRELKDRP